MSKKVDAVSLTYKGEWTNGETYELGCAMCQTQGAGLSRMIPIPTILVKLQHGSDSQEQYLCKGCIDRGIKDGHVVATNPEPAGCPFSMGC